MNRDERKALRERVRRARKDKDMTQRQLADAAEVSLATVNNFERGESVPQYASLVRILRVLDIEGDASTTAESYPIDVRNFLLMMGAYLSQMDEPTRLRRIAELVREIVRSNG